MGDMQSMARASCWHPNRGLGECLTALHSHRATMTTFVMVMTFLLCSSTAVPQHQHVAHELGSSISSLPSKTAEEVGPDDTPGLQMQGAVPNDGTCPSESDTTSIGNHCVKLSGAKLTTFQTNTNQDFSSDGVAPTQWCVCLHLYAEQKSSLSSLGGSVDCTQCATG